MNDALLWPLLIALAYLVGSVPFGLIIGLLKGVDIRLHGSRNIGATNAGRVLGRRWGMLCFALDVAKGLAPVLVAGSAAGLLGRAHTPPAQAWLWLAVAIAAILGHMFPVFINFKGGKGVATGFGALAGVYPALTTPVLGALLIWLITARLTRFVSVASCTAAVAVPALVALAALNGPGPTDANLTAAARLAAAWPFLTITAALAAVIIWKHRANLARLRAGAEPRIGAAPPRAPDPDPADYPDDQIPRAHR